MVNKYRDFILKSGIYTIFKCYRKYLYYMAYSDNIPLDIMCYESFKWYAERYPRIFKVCLNVYTSRVQKVKRVKTRIVNMLYTNDGELKDCLFLTLTFKDDVLDSTSQKTRRVYVSRYLKSQYSDYVANIDFGDKNEREHYHAIVGADFVDLSDWYDVFGGVYVEHIRRTPEKIAQYINKLTYHSVKDTAGFLIYSRNNAVAKAD